MRFHACSRLGFKWTAHVAVAALAAFGAPALARDDMAPMIDAEAPPSASAVAGQPARVFIATPVGAVSVGTETDGTGRRMFAARSELAGSASVVSFSATPPRPALLNLPSSVAAPLSRAALTSPFGARRSTTNGGVRSHAGVDLAAPLGSPVAAALPGRVSTAGWVGGYGYMVVLQHGNGLETRYAHLSSIRVTAGQQIQRGQTVGLVGSTGHSTGPHLHYELRQNGRPLNPLSR